jgi:type I restriction enzyme, S subunit
VSAHASLGSVAELIRGVTFTASDAHSAPVDGSLGILRAGNIQDALDTGRDLVWVDMALVSPSQRFRLGDVAICMSSGSASLVGKSAVLTEPFDGSVGAFCAIVRPRPGLDPHYLGHYLRSPAYWSWRDRSARGVGIQNLKVSDLQDLPIPLPPLDEQRRIAARLRDQLREVDGLTVGTTARNTELADFRISVYETAFPITPLSVTAESASPDGWTWRSLGSLGRLESGHTPSRSRPDWWGGDIPWIALPDIRALDGRHVFETLERTNPEGIAHSAARVLPAGTVVLSRTASVGFVTIMGRPMATSQDFVNWVCGPDLDPGFLMHLFIRSRERFRSLSAGAVHKTVYFPTAMALRVCVPPFDEQRRIADRLREQLAEIDQAKAALEAQRAAIDALPAALLREVFGASPVGG